MIAFVRSHYSILLSTATPDKIVKRCKEQGYSAACLCDLSTISGALAFQKACKKAGIKPIIGCSFYQADSYSTTTIIAKNRKGWDTLLELIHQANIDHYYESSIERIFPRLVNTQDIDCENLLIIDDEDIDFAHYCHPEDKEDLKVLLAKLYKTTVNNPIVYLRKYPLKDLCPRKYIF